MKHHEGTFQGVGSLSLFYQSWQPEGEAKGVLAIVHGFGEHCGRYSHIVNHLVPQGFAVYGFDHRGHGRSADKPTAHVNRWSEYHGDVERFLQLVGEQMPGLPLFLMGQSMGGLIVLGYALDHPAGLKGVIASAPAVGDVDAPPLMMFLGRIFSKIVPRLSMDSRLNDDAISRDPDVVRAYQDDPLGTGMATARFSTEFTKAIENTRARAAEFQPPLLILHGASDSLVPEVGSRLFFEKVRQTDKERIVYEGGYHEPHNDLQYEQVVADIHRWLEAHL